MANFKIHGYSVDVYVNRKLMGSYTITEPDRDVYGYMGRRTEILQEDLQLKKHRIKAGTEIVTELHQICGRLQGTHEENIQTVIQAHTKLNCR